MKQAMIQHTRADSFKTPAYAVEPLIPYIKDILRGKDVIAWEPTVTDEGESGIVPVLEKHGFRVETSDFDFLTYDTDPSQFDFIITNPPFTKKDQFIRKCLDYGKPFALLLPITAFEGQKRGAMWREMGDRFGCLVFDKRVEYTGGGVWFNTSWFTYKIVPGVKFHAL